MTTKHTQEEWLIAGENNDFVYALGPNGGNKFWAPVSSAGSDRISNEEKAANALLIAAAPCLLVQLTDLLAMCERQEDFNDDGDGGIFERARAAIIKATGAA